MKNKFIKVNILALFILSFTSGAMVSAANGPDYIPPFEVKQGARQDAVINVQTFLDKRNGNKPVESASLVVGNKRVTVRELDKKRMTTKYDNLVSCYINDKTVLKVVFSGGYRNSNKKWISFSQQYKPENVVFKANKAEKTIFWSNPYTLPDGKKTRFSYELKSLGQSRIALSWDIGCTEKQVKEYNQRGINIGGCAFYFDIPGIFRKNGIVIEGKAIPVTPEAELRKNEHKKINIWQGKLTKLAYNPGSPINGLSLICKDGLSGSASEIFHYRRIDLGFRLSCKKSQGEIIIDLGEAAVKRADAPPPVEGHDMWKQNALHMPLSPTRNLFPNPSFEQGLRYWRWWRGGAYYSRSKIRRFDVDHNNACFGKSSMVINPTQTRSQPLRSFSLPGLKGRTYTVSFYAKAEKDGAFLKLAPFSSKSGGQFSRSYTESFKQEKLEKKWKRYSYSFVSDGTPVALILFAVGNDGKIWLDGIQYERGKKATAFVSPPLEGRRSRVTTVSPARVRRGHLMSRLLSAVA